MKLTRLSFWLVALASLILLLALPAAAQASKTLPSSYQIKGVPEYTQLDSSGCGAACMAMVFDYWGPKIDYKEIVDVAESDQGTQLPSEVRAAQFSSASYAVGYKYPGYEVNGYVGRSLGYGAFYYASTTPWLQQLKAIIAQGYPVICLTNWLPGVYGPHYRVVTGYNDKTGTLTVMDPYPWGSDLEPYVDPNPLVIDWKWPYKDFLSVWSLSTSDWGVPNLNYGAILVAPWKVRVSVPRVVHRNQQFRLGVRVTYPCLAPFGSSEFPQFPASSGCVRVKMAGGIRDVDGTGVVPLYGADFVTVQPGERVTVHLRLQAGRRLGSFRLRACASATVAGSIPAWGFYSAYDYADRVGSIGSHLVKVIR
jgi:hypothetical protein